MMKKKYVILLMCFMMITFLSSCMKKSSFGGSMQNEMDAPDTDYNVSLVNIETESPASKTVESEENQDVIKSSSSDGKYIIVADQSQGKYNVELFNGDEKNKLKTYN